MGPIDQSVHVKLGPRPHLLRDLSSRWETDTVVDGHLHLFPEQPQKTDANLFRRIYLPFFSQLFLNPPPELPWAFLHSYRTSVNTQLQGRLHRMSLNRISSLESFSHLSVEGHRRSPSPSSRDRRLSFNPLPESWDPPTSQPGYLESVGAFEVPKWKRVCKLERRPSAPLPSPTLRRDQPLTSHASHHTQYRYLRQSSTASSQQA